MGVSTAGTGSGAPRSLAAVSLWRAKWAILAVTCLAFVASYQYGKSQPATYTAQSRIVLSAAQPFDPLGAYSNNDPNRYVADQVAIVETQAILAPAAQQLTALNPADPMDPIALAGSISAEPSIEASVIIVSGRASNPEAAVARANAVATAYEAYLGAQVRAVIDSSLGASTDRSTIEDIRAKAAAYGDGVAVVEQAAAGEASSSLAPKRSAALVTAVVALIATGLALLWRRPPPDGTAVIGAAGTRLLGTTPGRSLRPGRPTRPQDYAHALVALDYARQDTPGPVLLTGSSTRSGAASVAYGLALSAAAQGRRVLLVDADPDRRELVRVGGAGPARSLEESGLPGVSRNDVLGPVPGHAGLFLAKVGQQGSPLVDGVAVGRALAQLGAEFDLVLVQTAPVPESPVAFGLVEHVSGVVLVARGQDTARSAEQLRDRLEVARRPLIGLLITGRRRSLPWSPSSPQAEHVPEPEPAQRVEPATAPARVHPAREAGPVKERGGELGAPTR